MGGWEGNQQRWKDVPKKRMSIRNSEGRATIAGGRAMGGGIIKKVMERR